MNFFLLSFEISGSHLFSGKTCLKSASLGGISDSGATFISLLELIYRKNILVHPAATMKQAIPRTEISIIDKGCKDFLAAIELLGTLLEGRELSGVEVLGMTIGRALVGHKLLGEEEVGSQLDGLELLGSKLDGMELEGVPLDGTELLGKALVGLSLDGVIVLGDEVDGIILDGTELDGGELKGEALDGKLVTLPTLIINIPEPPSQPHRLLQTVPPPFPEFSFPGEPDCGVPPEA